MREKIFRLLGDEVPYATTVPIDRFEHEGRAAPDSRHGLRRQDEPARDPARRRRRAHEGASLRRRGATWSGCSAARYFSRSGCKVKSGWADDERMLASPGLLTWPMKQLSRAPRRPARLRAACVRLSRDEPDRRGADARRTAASRWSPAAPSARARSCAASCRRFQPLLLSWAGSGELKTLLRGRVARRPAAGVGGSALLCGFYLNELLLKLLPREDPHPQLFRDYEAALARARRGRASRRRCCASSSCACSPSWATRCRSRTKPTPGAPVDPGGTVLLRVRPRTAPTASRNRARRYPQVRGATLLALAGLDFADAETPPLRPSG